MIKDFKKILLAIFILNPLLALCQWEKYFQEGSIRIDYNHSGRVGIEYYTINRYQKLPFFAGSKTSLIDSTNNGAYKIALFDNKEKKIIYSKGFSSLFNEWLSTKEATNTCGNFEEVLIIPYPKTDVDIVFYSRDSVNNWQEITRTHFEENQVEDLYDNITRKIIPLNKVNKPLEKRLDVVILPIGYTSKEEDKMNKDLKTFNDYLFSIAPYSEMKDKINVIGIEYFCEKSGIPGLKGRENDVNELGVHYNTFGSERYIMTERLWDLNDVLNQTPYDAVILMCNSDVYGGGGIYNYYATCYVGERSREVLVHEFSHSFAGLGDEYSDNDSDAGLSSEKAEPYEKNITTLKNFNKKWKTMIDNSTPIPTPSTKEYDNKIGVFEGAAYKNKGFYRPYQHCMMRDLKPFCPICTKVIKDMLNIYCN